MHISSFFICLVLFYLYFYYALLRTFDSCQCMFGEFIFFWWVHDACLRHSLLAARCCAPMQALQATLWRVNAIFLFCYQRLANSPQSDQSWAKRGHACICMYEYVHSQTPATFTWVQIVYARMQFVFILVVFFIYIYKYIYILQ